MDQQITSYTSQSWTIQITIMDSNINTTIYTTTTDNTSDLFFNLSSNDEASTTSIDSSLNINNEIEQIINSTDLSPSSNLNASTTSYNSPTNATNEEEKINHLSTETLDSTNNINLEIKILTNAQNNVNNNSYSVVTNSLINMKTYNNKNILI
eukprot:248925_1